MTLQTHTDAPETVLQRIDSILDELLALRESVEQLLSAQEAKGEADSEAPSVLDIVRSGTGHREFHSAGDVAQYLREERTGWDS